MDHGQEVPRINLSLANNRLANAFGKYGIIIETLLKAKARRFLTQHATVS